MTSEVARHCIPAEQDMPLVDVCLFVYFLICACVTARAKPHDLAPAHTALVQHPWSVHLIKSVGDYLCTI